MVVCRPLVRACVIFFEISNQKTQSHGKENSRLSSVWHEEAFHLPQTSRLAARQRPCPVLAAAAAAFAAESAAAAAASAVPAASAEAAAVAAAAATVLAIAACPSVAAVDGAAAAAAAAAINAVAARFFPSLCFFRLQSNWHLLLVALLPLLLLLPLMRASAPAAF